MSADFAHELSAHEYGEGSMHRSLDAAIERSHQPAPAESLPGTAEEIAAGVGLEEVLAAHELVGKSVPAEGEHGCRLITKPHDGCGCQRIVVGCTGCDWIGEADGTQGDAHRAHIADTLTAAGFAHIATARAEALREVSDAEAEQIDRAMGDHMHGHVISNSPGYFACDSRCRTDAIRRAVQHILRERAEAEGK